MSNCFRERIEDRGFDFKILNDFPMFIPVFHIIWSFSAECHSLRGAA